MLIYKRKNVSNRKYYKGAVMRVALFKKIMNKLNLNDQSVELNDVLLSALLNNETITRDKALTLPAVSGAVDFISGSIASMPVKLYKYKNGKVEEVQRDSRVRMLNGDTGNTLDGFQTKKAMVEDYLLGKGGYCFIQRDRQNNVTALKYIPDMNVTVWSNSDPMNRFIQFYVGTDKIYSWNMVKLLRNTKDGASGKGLTEEISKALETAYSTLVYQLVLVKTGGNKKGFLQAERRLGQEEIDKLKEAWKKLYTNNTDNVMILNNGIKFQESSNSSVEMQLNESKKTLQDEINGVFHIHSDFSLTFKEAIYPIVKAFETAINSTLLLEKEKKNFFFEFDTKEIVKASIKERFDAYKVAKDTGLMTINELRRMENFNYIEGMDVINVGLGAVLYDTNTGIYYTPNTGQVTDGNEEEETAEKVEETEKGADDELQVPKESDKN